MAKISRLRADFGLNSDIPGSRTIFFEPYDGTPQSSNSKHFADLQFAAAQVASPSWCTEVREERPTYLLHRPEWCFTLTWTRSSCKWNAASTRLSLVGTCFWLFDLNYHCCSMYKCCGSYSYSRTAAKSRVAGCKQGLRAWWWANYS